MGTTSTRHQFHRGFKEHEAIAKAFAEKWAGVAGHHMHDGTRIFPKNVPLLWHIENAIEALRVSSFQLRPESFVDYAYEDDGKRLRQAEEYARNNELFDSYNKDHPDKAPRYRLTIYEYLDGLVLALATRDGCPDRCQGYPDGYLADYDLTPFGLSRDWIATTIPIPAPSLPDPETSQPETRPEPETSPVPTQASQPTQTAPQANPTDPMGMFNQFLSQMVGQIVDSKVKEAEERLKGLGTSVTITLVKADGSSVKLPAGTYHKLYEPTLKAVNAGMPVYLYGPAGTGKNVLCSQVAKALDLKFYYMGALQDRYSLSGFIDANGMYQDTEFYRAFTQGGLLMLDEMDASSPEALVALNGAIANGYFDFPKGREKAHENFRVIGAGNTAGFGADESYTGRNKIDYASIDRFFCMHMDYDRRVELAIAQGDEDLVNFAHALRDDAKSLGLDLPFGTRCIQQFVLAKQTGMGDIPFCLKGSFCKGLDKDSLKQLQDVLGGDDVYRMAFRKVRLDD